MTLLRSYPGAVENCSTFVAFYAMQIQCLGNLYLRSCNWNSESQNGKNQQYFLYSWIYIAVTVGIDCIMKKYTVILEFENG